MWALTVAIVPYAAIQLVLVPLLIQSRADARAMFDWLAILGISVGLLALIHLEATQNTQRLQLGAAGAEGTVATGAGVAAVTAGWGCASVGAGAA